MRSGETGKGQALKSHVRRDIPPPPSTECIANCPLVLIDDRVPPHGDVVGVLTARTPRP